MKRILIIEDDAGILGLMTNILTRAGYHVEGGKFLATLIGETMSVEFDLITIDLGLPEIDGLEVAHYLSRNTDTPILIVSAYLDESVIEKLKQHGLRYFLPKPFGMSSLLKAVEEALCHI